MKGGRLLEPEDPSPKVSKAREMEWMDLVRVLFNPSTDCVSYSVCKLLEVSMTTAFANLADNTAVHSGKACSPPLTSPGSLD